VVSVVVNPRHLSFSVRNGKTMRHFFPSVEAVAPTLRFAGVWGRLRTNASRASYLRGGGIKSNGLIPSASAMTYNVPSLIPLDIAFSIS
jgi:hypothetical protein